MQRFERMRPLFERYGVKLVAVSKDSVPNARTHRARDGLTLDLLCDPDLRVIRQFGLLHRKGFEFFTFFVLGIPLGYPTGFKEMAIPTTLLVDEEGIVNWIDQATDYRLRGDEARIEGALATAFPEEN